MIIAVDFDGTCVTHDFPSIGKDIGAVPVLQALVASGHQLILWTMRSDKEDVATNVEGISDISGKFLTEAVNWFKENDIELWGINENPYQKTWTSSPKAFANMYIDDMAVGCPLRRAGDVEKPFVDWNYLTMHFVKEGIITLAGLEAVSGDGNDNG